MRISVDKAIATLLVKLVSNPDPHTGGKAAKQLTELGSDAVAAVPVLIELVQAQLVAQPNRGQSRDRRRAGNVLLSSVRYRRE